LGKRQVACRPMPSRSKNRWILWGRRPPADAGSARYLSLAEGHAGGINVGTPSPWRASKG